MSEYIAIFWPIRNIKYDGEALNIIHQKHKILRIKRLNFSLNGLKNLMIEVYGKEKWLGDIEDHFEGALNYAKSCYEPQKFLMVVVFEAGDLLEVKQTKGLMREKYGIGNYSLHIPDTTIENKAMISLLFSVQSIRFMNIAEPYLFSTLFNNIQIFKNDIERADLDINRFAIDSSAVMEA